MKIVSPTFLSSRFAVTQLLLGNDLVFFFFVFFYSLFIVKKINLEFSVFFYSQPYERLILKLSFATSGSKVEKSNNREQTVKNMINFSKIRRKKTVMISGLKLNQFLVNINRNERCLHKL